MDGGSRHCTGGSDQDHPPKKEIQKGKCLPEEGLQIAVKSIKVKGTEKRKDISLECRVPKNSMER